MLITLRRPHVSISELPKGFYMPLTAHVHIKGVPEFAGELGVPAPTVRDWVRRGVIRPAFSDPGVGGRHSLAFDGANLTQGRAAAEIARKLGDGEAARAAMAAVKTLKAHDTKLVVFTEDGTEVSITF